MATTTIEFNEATFNENIKSGLTLVDMYTNWCMPCKMLAPTIAAIAADYEGKVTVGKINIDEAPSVAAKYGVMSIPTVILFKDGEPVAQKIGMANKSAYEDMIKSAQ